MKQQGGRGISPLPTHGMLAVVTSSALNNFLKTRQDLFSGGRATAGPEGAVANKQQKEKQQKEGKVTQGVAAAEQA